MTVLRVARLLDDLTRFGREASYLTHARLDAYVADTMDGALRRNAGERILIKIATVAERLPEAYKAAHPSVDWTGISRMRNLVAHHYDKINDELMWRALTVRIPHLLRALEL